MRRRRSTLVDEPVEPERRRRRDQPLEREEVRDADDEDAAGARRARASTARSASERCSSTSQQTTTWKDSIGSSTVSRFATIRSSSNEFRSRTSCATSIPVTCPASNASGTGKPARRESSDSLPRARTDRSAPSSPPPRPRSGVESRSPARRLPSRDLYLTTGLRAPRAGNDAFAPLPILEGMTALSRRLPFLPGLGLWLLAIGGSLFAGVGLAGGDTRAAMLTPLLGAAAAFVIALSLPVEWVFLGWLFVAPFVQDSLFGAPIVYAAPARRLPGAAARAAPLDDAPAGRRQAGTLVRRAPGRLLRLYRDRDRPLVVDRSRRVDVSRALLHGRNRDRHVLRQRLRPRDGSRRSGSSASSSAAAWSSRLFALVQAANGWSPWADNGWTLGRAGGRTPPEPGCPGNLPRAPSSSSRSPASSGRSTRRRAGSRRSQSYPPRSGWP